MDPKKIPNCEACKKQFTITRIRHQCKRCKRTICADCGKARIKIVTYDLKKPHKVCPECEREHIYLTNFKTTQQSQFGKMSKIAQKWVEKINPKGQVARDDESYQEYLNTAQNTQSHKADYDIINNDVMEGRSDRAVFNYSFQEFMYYNQEKTSTEEIRKAVCNVLRSFVIKYPNIGYCQGMSYIVTFLMGLADEETAFWLFCYIVAKVLPTNFFAQTKEGIPLFGFQMEKYVIRMLILAQLPEEYGLSDKLEMTLDLNGPSMVIPLFVNFLGFETCFEVWNRIIVEANLNAMRQCIIRLFELFIMQIKENPMINPSVFAPLAAKAMTGHELKNAFKLTINEEAVQKYSDEYKGQVAEKWASDQASVYFTLRKITHFTKQEIKQIQDQYNEFVGQNKKNAGPVGLNRDQFGQVIKKVTSDPEMQKYLDSIDMGQLFDVFDTDKSGTIDFKEFLSSLSMLMRGNMKEKSQYNFQIFDMGNKGYLNEAEYNGFLDSIVNCAYISNRNNTTVFFGEDTEKFLETMKKVPKKLEKVKFSEIEADLLKHPFIIYCQDNETKRKRGKTMVQIENSFKHQKATSSDDLETIKEDETIGTSVTNDTTTSMLNQDEESKIEEPTESNDQEKEETPEVQETQNEEEPKAEEEQPEATDRPEDNIPQEGEEQENVEEPKNEEESSAANNDVDNDQPSEDFQQHMPENIEEQPQEQDEPKQEEPSANQEPVQEEEVPVEEEKQEAEPESQPEPEKIYEDYMSGLGDESRSQVAEAHKFSKGIFKKFDEPKDPHTKVTTTKFIYKPQVKKSGGQDFDLSSFVQDRMDPGDKWEEPKKAPKVEEEPKEPSPPKKHSRNLTIDVDLDHVSPEQGKKVGLPPANDSEQANEAQQDTNENSKDEQIEDSEFMDRGSLIKTSISTEKKVDAELQKRRQEASKIDAQGEAKGDSCKCNIF